ncbi:Abhydrolase-3 domain-containing protein [Mycena sanguinolenta]|uniref:Abhydrolase-3 domain-containing protein n=1 Tax=Mycena sanguinolenta TaxID=230812 RepID=A0A8H6ZF94_9AGAR|nr:Abhydrolase-3 domain-containing protein [Mycena sanguinolenta]
MAQYSHLSDPDPEFAPHMARMTATPLDNDFAAARARFNTVFVEAARKTYAPGLPKDTEYRVEDHHVDVENGRISVRSLIPTSKGGSTNTYPLMVWLHGGGWMSGDVELDDYQLRAICVELQISIVNVDYRLTPEHRHPTCLNDSYAAVKWAADNAELLCVDLKKGFLIAGLSAGGHLAAVLAHRARDDPFFEEKKLTGSLLQIPGVLNHAATPEKYKPLLLSLEQNKDAPVLSKEKAFWYLSHLGGDPEDPEVSPLLYPSHKGLPPTVLQVCGLDLLRDEALLYDSLLRGEGVKTKTTVYPGVPHGFQYMFPSFKLAVQWEQDYRAGIRWLLDGAPQ